MACVWGGIELSYNVYNVLCYWSLTVFLSQAEFKCVSEHYWKTKTEKPIIVFGYKPIKLNSGMFKMDILL